MTLNVLLVDDHALVRKGFRALLLNHFPHWEIREAGNGVQAILTCSATPQDIVLMDYDMPKLDGLAAAKQILRASPGTRILMVSMHNEDELILKMRESGVMGIVNKAAGDDELLLAIDKVRNGIKHFPLTGSSSFEQAIKNHSEKDLNGLATLTPREAEIFRMLTSGRPPALIADALSISIKTLDTHKMSIFRKCKVHSMPELVRFAFLHNAL
jgi:DNA-binding NarL/FixJ family response regulator